VLVLPNSAGYASTTLGRGLLNPIVLDVRLVTSADPGRVTYCKGILFVERVLALILFRLRRIFVLVLLNSAGRVSTGPGRGVRHRIISDVRPAMMLIRTRLMSKMAKAFAIYALEKSGMPFMWWKMAITSSSASRLVIYRHDSEPIVMMVSSP
jgi:hypothetical protein